jgi:hypothetical protein
LGFDVLVFEDDSITLSVEVEDTASDMDSLTVCWDSDARIDSNSDGNMLNDCEMQGLEMTTSWSTRGIRQITATVTDDDGAEAMTSVNVSVLNLPPSATITNSSNVFELMEGDNITLSGLTSRETVGDKLTLRYDWDSDLIDSDLDGDMTGEIDFTGPEYTITNLEPGTWTFFLTVTDDDSEFATSSITITVAEKPAEGVFESVSEILGSVPTTIIAALALLVIILAGFLLLTRRRSEPSDDFSAFDNVPKEQPPLPEAQASYAAPEPSYGMPAQATSQPHEMYAPPTAQSVQQAYDPYVQQYATTQPVSESPAQNVFDALMTPEIQPVAAPVAAPLAPSGPQLPASGLPEGWSMDQWQHYGEQYLAAQMGQSVPAQPTTTNTPTQSAGTDMSSFLDDLDL